MCGDFVFVCEVSCFLSKFAINLLMKRALVAFLNNVLAVHVAVSVLCPFLGVPLVGWSVVCDCGISLAYFIVLAVHLVTSGPRGYKTFAC